MKYTKAAAIKHMKAVGLMQYKIINSIISIGTFITHRKA